MFFFSYADHISVADDVLIDINNVLTPAKVINVTNFMMQGDNFIWLNYVTWWFKICSHSVYIILFLLGAYVPLTKEGRIIVDGVLASCYASYDHNLAHFTMTPMQWFSDVIGWIIGDDNGSPAYVNVIGDLGDWFLPYNLLFRMFKN